MKYDLPYTTCFTIINNKIKIRVGESNNQWMPFKTVFFSVSFGVSFCVSFSKYYTKKYRGAHQNLDIKYGTNLM
jgi:hypothetical protein